MIGKSSCRVEKFFRKLISDFISNLLNLNSSLNILILIGPCRFSVADIYTPVIGENEETDKLLKRLKGKLSQELLYHKQAFEVLGAIDALTSASTIHSTNDDMMT